MTPALVLASLLTVTAMQDAPEPQLPDLTVGAADEASRVLGLSFTDEELAMMLGELADMRRAALAAQGRALGNEVPPALVFDPLLPDMERRVVDPDDAPWPVPEVTRPDDLAELVFADVPTLSALIHARQVSCVELTELCLARLRALDDELRCVISYTEERALAQAAQLDQELARGASRGPLHGIPWGAKDLFAVRGTRTTWGATPFRDQVLDLDATVVQRLDAAGAVLVAKLSLGALAYGDIWFDGRTNNPWNTSMGSSGSSAGPAAAVAAGCVPFAIGTETYGSIVSPSVRCGNSSLRPTFGRVSRHGAMALVWSMDKIGPMARSLRDAALVFDAIVGSDGLDPSVQDHPWRVPGRLASLEGVRLGVPAGAFDGDPAAHVLDELAALGAELVDVQLPDVRASNLNAMLMAESAAAFDQLTRDGRDDELVWQAPQAWPNSWRATRFLPAVEYVRAARLRTLAMREMDAVMAGVDLLVHPPYAQDILLITNHTGHPTAVAPAGLRDGQPYSVCFTGQLFDETRLLAVATAWQESTAHHHEHPDL